MTRCLLLLAFALPFIFCLSPDRACALEVIEAYRNPLGGPRWVSVNPSDGSCWLAANSGVMHIAADGTILSHLRGISQPMSLGVCPADGSWWVLDGSECAGGYPSFDGSVVLLDESGAEVVRVSFPVGEWGCCPAALGVNQADGSCWAETSYTSELLHIGRDGEVLWRGTGVGAEAISVNPTDGSCWVAGNEVVHLAEDGTELWWESDIGTARAIAANPTDGSCWVGERYPFVSGERSSGRVFRLAENGTELVSVEGFGDPVSVSVDPTDGSCWVADLGSWDGSVGQYFDSAVVHLAEDGTELWRGGFQGPVSVAVNPMDGSCWVADSAQVVHLSEEGEVLWRMDGFSLPRSVSVVASDGSCWVGDTFTSRVGKLAHLAEDGTELWSEVGADVSAISSNPSDGSCWVGYSSCDEYTVCDGLVRHLAEDGTELWRGTEFSWPLLLSVNPTDGSCWVADSGMGTADSSIVHLAEDGTELWRTTQFSGRLSVNSADGSCWVASGDVIHLAEDGTELWRGTDFSCPRSVSVNSADGSCWVTESSWFPPGTSGGDVVHLAEDGRELWRGQDFLWCAEVAVNPTDGSCWVATQCDGYVALLAGDGTELWRGEDFVHPSSLSVDPTDGSCWVADPGTSQIVHLVIHPPPVFGDVPVGFWAYEEIGACVAVDIVQGYDDGLYRPDRSVTRGQMAVYVSRALAGGDESVPDFTDVPKFPDVGSDHWALDYVEYAVDQNVVAGYEDGYYHSEYDVTRDQMAVYVARAVVAPTGEAALADYVPADPRNFPDVPSDFWSYKHIEYCVENGVVQGYEDGYYRPEIIVTRDQMAVYVARAFELQGEEL
jgi:DNA-binding beta-propeller fold protein YncE